MVFIITGCKYNDVTITYVIKEDVQTVEYNNKIIITFDILNSLTEKEIEGMYLDENYSIKYNNEQLVEDTRIYL